MFFRYLSISCLLFFILCTFLGAQDETRPTVAILDFEGQDISVQEVQTLTERMRTEIGNTNAVRLIERKAIESIMAEQGLAQSGCVTDECAAEVGQLLGVQFMINGSIGKIGDSFTIDVKMFSVETGATERSAVTTGDIFLEDLKVSIYGGIPYNEEFTGTAQQNLKLFSIDPSLRGTKKAVRKEAWDGMRKPAVPGYISDNFGLVDTLIGKVVTYSNVTHEGDIEGLLVEMQILAWEIVGLEAPPALKLKRAGASEKQTVAVLDFEGRGITIMEAQTLTDRFMTAMANTDRVQLVDRATMWDVLSEQGYTATECTSDECAAEVGAILGVELMVNGSIGKIGNTYTIDAKMFSVATGATERSKNVTHEGDIEGLLVEMQILAWEIVGLEAPTTQAISETLTLTDTTTKAASTSQAPKTQVGALVRGIAFPGLGHLYSNERKWAYLWMGAEAVMGALIYSTYSAHQSATTDWNNYQQLYLNERDIALLLEHKQNRNNSMADIEAANGQLALLAGIASFLWIANAVDAYMIGPGSEKKKKDKEDKKSEPEPEPAVEEQALSRVDIKLVYDPALQQTQLKFSIPLH